MINVSPRVKYWRDRYRRGESLFFVACASEIEARNCLALAPDLLLFHPGFRSNPLPNESGMLLALEPTSNANEAVAAHIFSIPGICAPCPVAIGVCGTDPFFLHHSTFSAWRQAGIEGVINYPTIGLTDGYFRSDLERSGLGIQREIDCLQRARIAGLFTVGFACRPQDAVDFADAGCDALIIHLGLTADYTPRPLSTGLYETWNEYLTGLRSKGTENPLLLLHGEHLIHSEDLLAWKVANFAGCAGVFAGSNPERLHSLRALHARE